MTTEELQAALDVGGIVDLDGATVTVQSLTIRRPRTTLRNGTLKQKAGQTNPLLALTKTARVTLEDLTLDGNKADQSTAHYTIDIQDCNDLTLTNVSISESSLASLRALRSYRVSITGGTLINAGLTGPDTGRNEVLIAYSEYVTVASDLLSGTGEAPNNVAVLVSRSNNCTIAVAEYEGYASEVVQIANYRGEGVEAFDSRPVGNVVRSGTIRGSVNAFGVHIGPNADENTVEDMTIEDTHKSGVMLGAFSEGAIVRRVNVTRSASGVGCDPNYRGGGSISDVIISQCDFAGLSLLGSVGNSVADIDVRDVTLVNNGQEASTYATGVTLGGYTSGITLTNIHAYDDQDTPTQKYGLVVRNDVGPNDYTESGNDWQGSTSGTLIVPAD